MSSSSTRLDDASARRELRVDLSSIDDALAKKLWTQYGGAVQSIARRLFRIAERSFVVCTVEDLVDIGRVALYEAHVRFYQKHDRVTERGFLQWMYRIVRWRIVEAISELRPEGLMFSARADSHNGGLSYRPSDTESPEERLQRQEVRAWFRAEVGRLSARQSVLIVAILGGESLSEAGSSLGISKSRAHQEYQLALEALRKSARAAGITGLGTLAWLEEPFSR